MRRWCISLLCPVAYLMIALGISNMPVPGAEVVGKIVLLSGCMMGFWIHHKKSSNT